jgi:hypothetical protein
LIIDYFAYAEEVYQKSPSLLFAKEGKGTRKKRTGVRGGAPANDSSTLNEQRVQTLSRNVM